MQHLKPEHMVANVEVKKGFFAQFVSDLVDELVDRHTGAVNARTKRFARCIEQHALTCNRCNKRSAVPQFDTSRNYVCGICDHGFVSAKHYIFGCTRDLNASDARYNKQAYNIAKANYIETLKGR